MKLTTSLSDLMALIVEPSAMQARYIAGQLARLGIENVHVAGGGASALAGMHDARPDVVISAMYLPDMSGADLVQQMRAEPDLAEVAFLLVSSETRWHLLDPVRQSGACGILPKPFTDAQLRTALHATLEYLNQDTLDMGPEIDMEALRVLIVDDSAYARRFIRRVLESLGIGTFCEAENGREAVALLDQDYVDLVVTDYNMPEMDGRELVEHIRQRSWQRSVPVLMVTSESDQGRLAAVEDAGVSGICDKPFEPGTVKTLLRRMLAH